ncbi:MAG: alpha-L-fucosidase [Planctomycetes bacterium]|nr:alpha-L-fucosidase [Planctomycetota bacterium]
MSVRAMAWVVLLGFAVAASGACATGGERLDAQAASTAPTHDERMAWWRDARFGLFIHWGLYSVPGGEWNGQTGHAEWIRTTAQIPVQQYEELLSQFDPVDFDADAWVAMAKAAGMRYVVITSKHHDGFCLFDSALTDWDVMSTPFRRDIMGEIVAACRRQGMHVGFYHSIMDWHHPDYLPRRGWEDWSPDGAEFDRFVQYLHGQVTELLTKYGPIDVLWFDGEWESTWTHEQGEALYDLCRSLQPSIIVNNRVDKGRGGMAGLTDEGFVGDFGTPEQEVPAEGLPGVDWESCMTMNDHWGWNRADHDWKSVDELVRTLIDIASKGGNFLLNVGPTERGTFPPEAVERLAAMGRWMDVHGDAIHGTTASPFGVLPWGRCTMRSDANGTRLFLHVFDWPETGRLVVPGLGNTVRRAALMESPDASLPVARDEGDVIVTLPATRPDVVVPVLELDVEGAPIVYRPPSIVVPAPIFVRPIEVAIESGSPALEVRYTVDGSRPDATSPLYERPLTLDDGATVQARAFHDGRPVSGVARLELRRVEPWAASAPTEGRPGLRRSEFAGTYDALPDLAGRVPDAEGIVPAVALDEGPAREHLVLRYAGRLIVPEDDVYTFALSSDDGSRLLLDGRLVVDDDGLHGPLEERGVAPLAKGAHALVVEWFNKTGGAELRLRWARSGEALHDVPPEAFVVGR